MTLALASQDVDYSPPAATNTRKRKSEWLSLVVGVTYGLALATFAVLLGTWTDEEYTLATTSHGVIYAWFRAIDFEVQAPLYFAALAMWRELGDNVWFARLFSILCSTGFFFALIPLLRRVAPERNPIWPALLIALNPFVVYYALDIRLYAMALLISALGYNAFEDGFGSGSNLKSRIAFVVFSLAALYTQYLLGFAFIGYFAILLVRRRSRALFPFILALFATGVAAFPLVAMILSQVGKSGEATASIAALLRQTLLHPWLEFVLPYDRNLDSLQLHVPHMALIIAIALLVFYARPYRSSALLASLACAASIELSLVASVVALRLDLGTRHYVVLFVPALVSCYALFSHLARRPSPMIGRIVVSAYILLSFSALLIQQYHVAQNGDTKRIGAFLNKRVERDSIIAIYPADALPAYARQYHGVARLIPFPNELPTDRYDIDAIDVHDESEATISLLRLRSAKHAWLVMLGVCNEGWQQYGCQYVLGALHRNNRILFEHDFYDSRVFALDLRH